MPRLAPGRSQRQAADVVELGDDIDEGGDVVGDGNSVVLAGKRTDVELVDEEILEGRSAEGLTVAGEDRRIDNVALGSRSRTLDLLGSGVGAVEGPGNVVHASRIGDDVLVFVVGGDGDLVGGPVTRPGLRAKVEGACR